MTGLPKLTESARGCVCCPACCDRRTTRQTCRARGCEACLALPAPRTRRLTEQPSEQPDRTTTGDTR